MTEIEEGQTWVRRVPMLMNDFGIWSFDGSGECDPDDTLNESNGQGWGVIAIKVEEIVQTRTQGAFCILRKKFIDPEGRTKEWGRRFYRTTRGFKRFVYRPHRPYKLAK